MSLRGVWKIHTPERRSYAILRPSAVSMSSLEEFFPQYSYHLSEQWIYNSNRRTPPVAVVCVSSVSSVDIASLYVKPSKDSKSTSSTGS